MVPSVDTYVYKKVDRTLKAILKQPEILHQALGNIDNKARENFIKTYAGDKPKREIQVSYHFPGNKEEFDARYVIQMGSGHETTRSLGLVDDVFEFREGAESYEVVEVQEEEPVGGDEGYLYIEVSKPIGDFRNADSISFSRRDNVRVEENKIIFTRDGNTDLVGLETGIHYLSKEVAEEDPQGMKKGYSSNDEVEITPLSTNMDTARCMDALIKVIVILMADSPEEKITYLLQKVTFGSMQNIISDMDRLVFGRPVTIEYVVNYTIDYDINRKLKQIVTKGVWDRDGEKE